MNQLINDFRLEAIKKWDFVFGKGGTTRTAKKNHKNLCKIFDEIKGKNMLDEFSVLLNDSEESVVLEAGALLLKEKYNGAADALRRLTKNRGLISFTAKMSLQELS